MNEKINMPWEERPAGCTDAMWRYSKNPVIGRYHIPSSNSIFNSAVVPFEDGFAGGKGREQDRGGECSAATDVEDYD